MLTTLASYSLITKDLTRSLENTSEQPVVARETAYYLENIESVKSIEEFIGNDRLFRYAMKAHGLSDMAYAKAFMRKVLTEGVDKSESFANSLVDTRYREFAEVFNFARFGETTTVFDKTRQGTVDKYVRATLEEDAGAQNEGVRLALYFARKASGITSTLQLLADKAIMTVVDTALGIPDSVAAGDIDKHAALIEKKLDIEDLQDPEKLGKLLNRFATLWELENPSQSATSPAVLLIGQPIEASIGVNLLATLQNLKLGGS
ncbi:MAG: DUF1217 domain-containing protein [Kofleriaceae bacterium]|nr:DUF1217 domain-containing protein [Kofleriaceae bacterium]